MGENSAIEWTDHTLNFWWGCFKVSPGCANCYAEDLVNRLAGDENIWGPPVLTERKKIKSARSNVLKWNRKAKREGKRFRVFVQSMSDFFEDHPRLREWRDEALALMQECIYLDFQVLTKRPENISEMIEVARSHSFSDIGMWCAAHPHIWFGTSVESQDQVGRVDELLKIPARIRFLSCEPLLGDLDLSEHIDQIDWVIVGGESGKKARPMHPVWASDIRDQCLLTDTPFFFKQWGAWGVKFYSMGFLDDKEKNEGIHYVTIDGDCFPAKEWVPHHMPMKKMGKKNTGRELHGFEWSQMPKVSYR